MQDIYSLKLMDSTTVEYNTENYTTIQRVPGGWIFTEYYTNERQSPKELSTSISSVFVPYNDEFKDKTKIGGF